MGKSVIMKILGVIIAIAVVIGGVVYFTKNKPATKNNESSNSNVSNEEKESNIKKDFWITEAVIPSKTKSILTKLVDGIDGSPIDLNKLDPSYTFNYREYGSDKPVDYKVHSISDVKGSSWDSGKKEITVKNSADETVFSLVIKDKCNDTEYKTYEEALSNNCWFINLNEDIMFNKKFNYKNNDGIKEIIQEIFNQLGKPTHVFVRPDEKLVIDNEGIGTLMCNIIYDYGSFKLTIWLNDTYNKKHDYRILQYYGLVYETNEIYGKYGRDNTLRTKDIISELVK